MDWH